MTLLLVFVGCLFTAFALWLMIAPFIGADRGLHLEHLDEEVREIERLVARRQVLLTSLRELDFDRETDKIAVEDYEKFRRRYEAEAVAIMRRLDEIHGGRDWQKRVDEELAERLGHEPQILGAPPEEDADDALEEDQEEPSTESEAPDDSDDDSEAGEAVDDEDVPADTVTADADGDEAASEPSGADAVEEPNVLKLDDADPEGCIECGVPLAADDRFCSQCGTPVAPPESEETATSEASA